MDDLLGRLRRSEPIQLRPPREGEEDSVGFSAVVGESIFEGGDTCNRRPLESNRVWRLWFLNPEKPRGFVLSLNAPISMYQSR